MGRPKTYQIDESVYDRPLTEQSAYVLGLLLSDGHLSYRRGAIQYACKTSDESLIGKILECLSSTHPIKRYTINKRSYSRISISNIRLCRRIIDTFDLPKSNKSMNNLHIPTNISAELMPNFLRGYFDGDGSIWKTKSGKTVRFLASYTGGEGMMMDIQKILSTLGISTRLSYKYGKSNKNSCSITVGSHDNVCALGKYLYNDAYTFLERKRELFKECQEHVQRSNAFYLKSNGSEEKIKILYIGGKTQKAISDELRIPFSTVRCCVQRLRKNGVVV